LFVSSLPSYINHYTRKSIIEETNILAHDVQNLIKRNFGKDISVSNFIKLPIFILYLQKKVLEQKLVRDLQTHLGSFKEIASSSAQKERSISPPQKKAKSNNQGFDEIA
jgi:hypothetical protein